MIPVMNVYGTGRNRFRFADNGATVEIVSVVNNSTHVRRMKRDPAGAWAGLAPAVRPYGGALYDCATQACNMR